MRLLESIVTRRVSEGFHADPSLTRRVAKQGQLVPAALGSWNSGPLTGGRTIWSVPDPDLAVKGTAGERGRGGRICRTARRYSHAQYPVVVVFPFPCGLVGAEIDLPQSMVGTGNEQISSSL